MLKRRTEGRALLVCTVAFLTIGNVRLEACLGAARTEASFEAQHANDTLEYALRAWQSTGRRWLSSYGGLAWDAARRTWTLDSARQFGFGEAAARAYYVEYAARPALNLAEGTGNRALLTELSAYYSPYATRFLAIAELRKRAARLSLTSMFDPSAPADARTLAWIDSSSATPIVRECSLCISQFLHPVSRLLRLIAAIPSRERDTSMLWVAQQYAGILVHDHLLRTGFQQPATNPVTGRPARLVDVWDSLSTASLTIRGTDQAAMSDRDLWLVATAAEVLGAHARDSSLLPVSSAERDSLLRMVHSGVALLRSKEHAHRVRDRSGLIVSTISYFDGDYADNPDYLFAGDTSAVFPDYTRPQPVRSVGWDISHAYRLPVVIRSLLANRVATSSSYPSQREAKGLARHYAFVAFEGDSNEPLFRNYLDGSDGWFRVGYAGRTGSGYPPSRLCDAHNSHRPCLTSGGVQGWGELAPFDTTIRQIEHSLVALAARRDSASQFFRDRYYYYDGTTFSFVDRAGREQYPILLLSILASTATDYAKRHSGGN